MLATLRSFRAFVAWPALAALAIYLQACVGYSAREVERTEPVLIGSGKVVVIHRGKQAMALDEPAVGKDGITGRTRDLYRRNGYAGPREAASPAPGGRVVLPPKGQRIDIHLAAGDTLRDAADLALDWGSIDRITVYDVSVGKTILIWTGAAIGAAAIAFVIFLLTKSSCPFVYADNGDGNGYSFQGEIFSGAIYPQLERDDWMPLPAPAGPAYRLRVTNEVKEIQHIDRAALWLVRHPPGTGVLLDAEGMPHTFSAPASPARCVTLGGEDASALVAARDSLAYMGGDGSASGGWSDGLDLAFAKPAGARRAKLILRARNSFWLDYLYGQFQDLFGAGLADWNEKMRKAPKEKAEAWFRDQGLPLAIEAQGPSGWSRIASLPLPGPMAARDFIVPFEVPPGDSLRVRLRCGFLFWEIDYAAVDFSPDLPAGIVRVEADSASDQDGRDLRVPLSAADGKRYDQPRVGDQAWLRFAVPSAPAGQEQSAFLASRGYYDILRTPQGRPRMAKLKGFREPGALPRFSAERMRERIGGGPHAL
jgi:hypothetical protein